MIHLSPVSMSLGVYIHIPFCRKRCGYCSFASQTDYGLQEAYFARLTEEIRSFEICPGEEAFCGAGGLQNDCESPADKGSCCDIASAGNELSQTQRIVSCGESGAQKGRVSARRIRPDVDTVYLGGGTPSSVSPGLIAGALREICGRFSVCEGAEISMECNPATVSEAGANAWISAGVNRFSVGLQSANDKTLARIGRLHRARDFAETIALLRRCGAANLSADVILGLPGESVADVLQSVRFALDQGVVHLSAYGLTVEEGTPLSREGYRVDEDLAADCYQAVCELCRSYGLERYEVSNFARPGCECRHNLRYWQMRDYAGFGLSAHSLLGDRRTFRTSDMKAYLAGAEPIEEETLTERDRACETLMLGMRLERGVALDDWQARFGNDLTRAVRPLLERYGDFLEIRGRFLRFTEQGFYVMNGLLVELLETVKVASID